MVSVTDPAGVRGGVLSPRRVNRSWTSRVRRTGIGSVRTAHNTKKRAGHGLPSPRQLGGGARREGRAPRGCADRGWHRCDGRDQLRPPQARVPDGPRPRRRSPRVGGGRRHRTAGRVRAVHQDHGAPPCRAAGPRARLAHGRLPADPQPRRRRRQPRHGLARRRRPPRPARRRRGGRGRVGGPRHPDDPDRRVLHRRQAQRAPAGRTDPRRAHQEGRRPAAVLQGRHPQRHGHRRLRLRPRAAPADAHRTHRHRLGRAHAGTGHDRRGVPERCPGGGRLLGRRSDPPPSVLKQFADLCSAACNPIDDVRGTASYRRRAVGVMARRTLTWTWESYRGGRRAAFPEGGAA